MTELELVGVECPVPNCKGWVKEFATEDPDAVDYRCEFGHVLKLR